MEQNILDELKNVEKKVGALSSAQKILLTTDGSVTAILDVLKGHVGITTLVQEFVPADEAMAASLNVDVGDKINYRVVIIGGEEPHIYAVSLVPVDRLTSGCREDLIGADIPIGRILKEHNIESRREIKSIYVEDADKELKEIFKTDSPFLCRTYHIINRGKILMCIKEMFPYSIFKE